MPPVRAPGSASSIPLPGGWLAHFLVVLREMVLDLDDVGFREVDAPAGALHDVACRHDCPRHGDLAAVDDVGEQQLVGGEVLLAAGVIPDMRVAVSGVGVVLGVRPGAYAFLGRRAVPFAVPGGEREV